jgi:hypothetical protein
MDRWACYLCPRSFLHARLLARHLEDVHGTFRCLSRTCPRPASKRS